MAVAEQAGPKKPPPFPLDRPTSGAWREQALSKIAELRFVRDWLLRACGNELSAEDRAAIRDTIENHLDAASDAAKSGPAWKPRNITAAVSGSGIERVVSQLDAVESELLRIAKSTYLEGEISSLLAHVQLHLASNDPRRLRLEALAQRIIATDGAVNGSLVAAERSRRFALHRQRPADPAHGEPGEGGEPPRTNGANGPIEFNESDRQAVISAVRAASSESRWKVSRLRSFRNVILAATLFLTLAVGGLTAFAFLRPSAIPICFTPANVVCTTSTTVVPPAERQNTNGEQTAGSQAATDRIMRDHASGWDVAVVELVGLIAAAIAAAAAIRNVQGTSTPYSLPVALAVLKLPTGALTAVLGLLLMRGGFVPGLSALDSSAQIVAWALVFGYAQQLLTRFVDSQAQTVLASAGGDRKSLAPPPALKHINARSY